MSEREQPRQEAERETLEDESRRPVGGPSGVSREVPLFLKGISDGWKGDAQDEKDETGE